MSFYLNASPVYYHEDIMFNGVALSDIYFNGIKVWNKVTTGSFSEGPIANWAFSYYTCADQAAAGIKTYTDADRVEFDFYGDNPVEDVPASQYPLLSVSNNGLIWKSTTTDDANNICQTTFIFSFMGYTYKVVNETKNKYLQRKPYGSPDTSYATISSGAQQYNGYTFLTVNIGWTTTVYIGNGAQLDLSQLIGYCDYNTPGYTLEPEYAYARNFHYAGCTGGYCYALGFTEI